MSAAKLKLNVEWLSSCGGCDVAIVDLHERVLSVLDAAEIQRFPMLTDVRDYPKADLGLISGAVRSEHDRHAAEQMRESCKTVVAFGTCAVYGGISAASHAHSRQEVLNTVYVNNKTTSTHSVPSQKVPVLEETVKPIDEVIPVDLYLPGCPPHPSFIFDALLSVVEGRTPKASAASVCGRCTRAMKKTDCAAVKAPHQGMAEPQTCFLSQGYVCLGSVTLDRCLAPCPARGTACTGCAGPTMQVLTEPNRDIRTEVADRMSKLTKIGKGDVVAAIERAAKSHYAYAMATRMVGSKPTFLIKKWIADVEAGR